jgi:hypothetical protein
MGKFDFFSLRGFSQPEAILNQLQVKVTAHFCCFGIVIYAPAKATTPSGSFTRQFTTVYPEVIPLYIYV